MQQQQTCPSPLPPAARPVPPPAAPARPASVQPPRSSQPRKPSAQHRVAWEARAPAAQAAGADGSSGSVRVWQALQLLFPAEYPSISAAKKACRRREILVDGEPATNPSTLLAGGELLQCVQRTGGMAQLPSQHPAAGNGQTAGAAQATGACMSSGSSGGAAILPLEVVYEDEHMACVVKPPGVPVDTPPGRNGSTSSGSGSTGEAPPAAAPSVYSRLARTLAPSQQLGALRRPRHCHRLDEPTGGLLLVGKTRQAQAALCGAFADRQVTKRYRALVWGRVEGRGRLTWELDGRHCDTEYSAVQHTPVHLPCPPPAQGCHPAAAELAAATGAEAGSVTAAAAGANGVAGAEPTVATSIAAAAASSATAWVTTVDLWPHTGRKHQLRRHMALLGHPLVGDARYTFGYAAARAAVGLALPPEGHQLLPAEAEAGQGGADVATAVAATEGQAASHASSEEAHGKSAIEPSVPAGGCDLPATAAAATAAHGLKLCLWAVELHLERHPATGEPLHFLLPEGEPSSFASVRAALTGGDGPKC